MIKLHLFVLLPIFFSLLIYLIPYHRIKQSAVFLQSLFLMAAILNFVQVKQNGVIVENLGGWNGYIGISLKADLVSSSLIMLNIFLFLCMLIYDYKSIYLDNLFIFLFLSLQGLINGIFLSNDLFNIYLMVELSTIVVSILIMYKKDSRSIYDGLVYLLINIIAMTFFLLGIGFIYKIFGVLDLQGIENRIHLIEISGMLIIGYCLIITAVSLKCALMPLFSWLPKAHGTPSAPSIVSAILSGLYVKSGIYFFIRIQEVFSGIIDTSSYFLLLGFLTGVIGFFLALSQTDIKLILAYHTISQIGLIMMGLNYPNNYTYWGSIYHIINHAFFKSTLFLTAGIIIEKYKTRNIFEIRGVLSKMPIVSIASILSMLGITGAPFFNGSISKYLIQAGTSGSIEEYGILIINLGTIISFIKYSSIFWGESKNERIHTDKYQCTIIMLLGIICLVGGINGQTFIYILFEQEININFISYMQKIFFYLVSLLAGIIIYKKIILKSRLLYFIKALELSFNGLSISITFFFLITLLHLIFKYSII